jgi:hypothetical protein
LNKSLPTNYRDTANGECWNKTGIFLSQIINITYFQWTIDNSSIFPTVKKTCRKASEVIINTPEHRELAGKYLHVLDYDGVLTDEWKKVLPFKRGLELDDYLTILSGISKERSKDEDLIKENRERILKIYTKIAENYLGYSQQLKNWANTNKLLARDDKFYSPKNLAYIAVEGFNAPNLIYANKPSDKVVELFNLWSVKVIDKITPRFSDSENIEDLHEQLKYVAPLIALVAVEKSKNRKDWEDEYKRIKNKLSKISFYKTSEIHISYGNEEDELERSAWAEGNDFYFVGNWYKPRVLDGLVEPLCKFLNIRYAERILTVLLSDEFSEGIKYLKEKGYDISLIPENLLNPVRPARILSDGDVYTPLQVDIGKKGELFVYEELKRIYRAKYGQPIKETKTGFKISNKVEIFWRNISEVSMDNHDFKVIESDREIYIDSKATPYDRNTKIALYITANELSLMETAEKYLIARVFNVTSKPSVEFIRLKKEKEL